MGGGLLSVTYGEPVEGEFFMTGQYDSALSAQLDANTPSESNLVLRPVAQASEWQVFAGGTPQPSSFDGAMTISFRPQTQIDSPSAFDPFAIMWDLHGDIGSDPVEMGSATISLGWYHKRGILARLLNLVSGDFDGNPQPIMSQLAKALDRVTALAENREFAAAVLKLIQDVLTKLDGFYAGDPNDDMIITLAGQQIVYPAVDEYRRGLKDAKLLRP
jgi:hypothetical protein